MRIGVLSTNNIQKTLIAETLAPVFGDIYQCDLGEVQSGGLDSMNLHLLVVDFSDEAIVESEEVLEMLDRESSVFVFNERQLYPMSPAERLAWRNKIVAEVERSLPDLATEILAPKSAAPRASLHDICIIGSSSGGPMTLKSFLAELPWLPITIVLVQHISLDAFRTFITMVQASTRRWSVEAAVDGLTIRPGQIIAVPKDTYVAIHDGCISLSPYAGQPTFNPSINTNIRSIYKTTPGGVGVIILTGMGDDGSAAIKELQGSVQYVMAQDGESCAARSMPEAARKTGAVTLTDTPANLAVALARQYGIPAQ